VRNRGRALLHAQRRPRFRGVALEPLTEGPPDSLDADARLAWADIIAATPARLAAIDAIMLSIAAQQVADWRKYGAGGGSRTTRTADWSQVGPTWVRPRRRPRRSGAFAVHLPVPRGLLRSDARAPPAALSREAEAPMTGQSTKRRVFRRSARSARTPRRAHAQIISRVDEIQNGPWVNAHSLCRRRIPPIPMGGCIRSRRTRRCNRQQTDAGGSGLRSPLQGTCDRGVIDFRKRYGFVDFLESQYAETEC